MELKGKVAVVTGGSKGYGKGIAKALKENGCRVWILSSTYKDLENTAAEIGVNLALCDITKSSDWDNALKKIIGEEKRIDILINNAGAGVSVKNLVEQSDEEINYSIMLNLTGHIYGISRTAKIMSLQKSGIIINISSLCADYAWPGWSVYSAAKAGIEMLARCLHNELRMDNVRVTTITPSWGATSFLKAANLADFSPDLINKVMTPEDMGELVVKVCTIGEHLNIPKLSIKPMVQEINPM